MAEYYAVLSKAIASLEADRPDARRAVYDKARSALIGQLKAIDPPLPTHEISRQRLELEEAIRKVEREAGTAGPLRVAAGRPAAARAQPEPPPPEYESVDVDAEDAVEDAQPVRQSPQDVFRRAIQEAERAATTGRAERVPPAPRAETRPRAERAERVPARPAAPPPRDDIEVPPVDDEPPLAPDYEWESSQAPAHEPEPMEMRAEPPPMPRVTVDDHADERPSRAAGRVKRGKQRGRIRDDMELLEQATPSRLPAIILGVLILAMLIGLGALAWWQRGPISEMLASFDSKQGTTETAATTTPPPAAVDTSGKNTDRLLGDGSQVTAPPADVRDVTPAPDDTSGASTAGTTGPDTSMPAADTTPPAAATTTADASTATAADADSLVAQRATLYEEPLDAGAAANGVVAIDASVRWSFGSGPDGPEVVANVDVPDRSLKVKVTFRRNTDATLPASHVVEVVIDAPTSFPGKGVREVPRVVMKSGEDQRGLPLIGASAKVADGFFWIALSGVDSDVATNVRLMKSQSWVDLPLVYDTGQRAILTFEKGNPGTRVFERALAAWNEG